MSAAEKLSTDVLLERLRDDPEGLIRDYPEEARRLADRAREADRTAAAERIDALIDELQSEGSP